MRDNLYMEGVLDIVEKSYVFPQVILSNKFYIWHDKFHIFKQVLSFKFSNMFYT